MNTTNATLARGNHLNVEAVFPVGSRRAWGCAVGPIGETPDAIYGPFCWYGEAVQVGLDVLEGFLDRDESLVWDLVDDWNLDVVAFRDAVPAIYEAAERMLTESGMVHVGDYAVSIRIVDGLGSKNWEQGLI